MDYGGTQSAFAQSASAIIEDFIGSRKKVSLWLDLKINRDIEALEIVQYMKSKRQFRQSVMTGLKIVFELRQGRVDTLLAEFPQVKEWLEVKVKSTEGSGGGQLDEINSKLEFLIANQRANGGYEMASTKPATVSAPVAVVSQSKPVDASAIADNFLSMFQ